jgi:hypothetical protein
MEIGEQTRTLPESVLLASTILAARGSGILRETSAVEHGKTDTGTDNEK